MKNWRKPIWAALLFTLIFMGAISPKVRSLDSPDFKVFYTAGRHAVESPELLYKVSPDRYLYPPEASLFFIPFAFTDNWEFHRWVWHFFLGSVLFVLAGASWAALGSAMILTRYLAINFSYGQVNLVILALMVLVATLLERKKISAGIVWAVATLTKVFPAVQIIDFILRRRYRDLALAATVMVAAASFTIGFWGWDTALSLHQQFFSALGSKGLPLHSHNQSLAAFFSRLFTQEIFELHSVEHVRWGWLPFSAGAAKGCALVIGALLSVVSWRKAAVRELPWDFCAAALFTVLFLSHLVWKDYFIFLFIPLFQILEAKEKMWRLVVVGFLLLITLSSRDVIGAYGAAFLDAASVHLWAAILVWWGWLRLEGHRAQEAIPT